MGYGQQLGRESVEERLIPLNPVLDLATPHGINRPILAEAGYQVAGLEVPCVTSAGNVVIDVVLAHAQRSHLIACEAKSGSNVEEDQARRYGALEARTVVSGAFVTLHERVDPHVEVMYAALADHAARVALGLSRAGTPFPVLLVHPDKVTLENADQASPAIRDVFASPVPLQAPPARHVPFDQDSDLDEIEPYVKAALVAALARRVPMISLRTLTEHATPHYALYGTKAQGRLRRRVGEVVQRIAVTDPDTFEYHSASGNHDAFVKLLRTPEDNDPRGRTQGYQRLARTRQRKRPSLPVPGQTSLLDELEEADNEGRNTVEEDAEETGGTS
jgi:hypothetical protein